MARGRKPRNYRELRVDEDYDEDQEAELEEEEDEDEDEDEDDESSDDDDDDEEAPKKKKKKAKPKAAAKPKTRKTRAAKVVRQRMVWGVFNNSHNCVATYEYKKKDEAVAHAEKLTAAKANNQHYIQPVKEPMPTEEAS